MQMLRMAGRSVVCGLLLAAAMTAPVRAGELEEEQVNPSEVTFRNGVPYYYDAGNAVRLATRHEGGTTIYYRMVRYDAQDGYLREDGSSVPARHAQATASAYSGSGRVKYYGNGLYGPDYYNSPYNRDARQRYYGPGYVGACDWRGCKEVHYAVPVYGYYEPY